MIFLCKFLYGVFGTPNTQNIIDTTNADYSDNQSNIFVTPYGYGIIPKYLICYYSWTK